MAIYTSIKALLEGEIVAGSKIKNTLLEELLTEGLLVVIAHGCRKSYRARDVNTLKRYLIDKDEKYRILEVDISGSRASLASETGNSKLTTIRSCPGFPVNSYESIVCRLNGKDFVVNPQEGFFIFITEWNAFSIPEDITIIGIENMENFRMIRRQKAFFEGFLKAHGLSPKILFVSRYPQSTDLRTWLRNIPNHYLHFGDFDLAGIHIFLSEFRKHLEPNRTTFLIPEDIEERIKSGSRKRYDDHFMKYKNIFSEDKEIQALIDLIHKYGKGYDQEGYIP